MTLQQLRYIVAIDDFRSFGKAAEACGLTQSTLSLLVKKLEEELDVRIFDRDQHPVAPTQSGRKIIAQARVVLFNAAQVTEMATHEKQLLSGPLHLGLISTVAPVLIPGLFRHIVRNHPALSLRTEEMLTSTLTDKLRKAEVDMGILAAPVGDPELLEIPLYHERFLAYVSESEPAYAQESIRLERLLERPVWIMKNGLQLFDGSQRGSGEDVSYEKYFEGGRVGTLIQIVNELGGLTVIPETHVGLILYSLQKNLRPIEGGSQGRTIVLAVRKDFIHEAMLNAVVDAIRSIIPVGLLDPLLRNNPRLTL